MRRLAVLMLALAAPFASAGDDEPRVVVHAPAKDLLSLFRDRGAGFVISAEEYETLVGLAKKHEAKEKAQPPLSARLVRGAVSARVDGDTVRMEAQFVAVVRGDRPAAVPFRVANAAVEALAVEGEGSELVGRELRFAGAGTYMVTATLSARVTREGEIRRAAFRLPAAAAATVQLALPANVEGEVGPIVRAFRTGADGGAVTGYPDGGGLFQVWWRPKTPERTVDPIVSAAFAAVASLEPARTRVSTRLELEVLRAPVDRVLLRMPDGMVVRSVQGAGIRTWSIHHLARWPGPTLHIAFTEPVTGTVKLRVDAELPRDADGAVEVPLLRAPEAVRFRGTLGLVAGDGVRVLDLDAQGARRLDAAPKGGFALYDIWSGDSKVTATVRRVAARTVARTHALLTLLESGKHLAVRFHYRVLGEPLFRLDPQLPPGWILRSVRLDGKDVEHRYHDDGRLSLVFPEGLPPGPHVLDAVLETDEVDWVPNEDAVAFDFAGVRAGPAEESGLLVVAADPAFRVAVPSSTGLEKVGMPAVLAAGFQADDRILHTWSFDRPGFGVRFSAERHRPQISVTVLNRVYPSERLLRVYATLFFEIERTGVREVSVSLPADAGELVDFQGPAISERVAPPAAGAPWTIKFQRRIRGPYRLDVMFDRKFEEDGWEAGVPDIAVPGAREEGFVVVHSAATTALAIDPGELRQADVAELPEQPERSPLEVLAYVRHPLGVTLRSQRHDPHAVVQAVALSAHIYGVIAPEGRLRCRAEYRVRNNDQPFLFFALPGDARLLAALVDGEPAKPLVEDGWSKVPLPKSRGREAPFLVALVYEDDTEPLDDKGELTIRRPLLDVDVLKTTYTLHLPDGVRVTDHDGDLVPRARDDERSVLGALAPLLPVPRTGGAAGEPSDARDAEIIRDQRARLRSARSPSKGMEDRGMDFEEDSDDAPFDMPASEELAEKESARAEPRRKIAQAGDKTPEKKRPAAPAPPKKRPERALLSLDVEFLKPDNVVRLDSLAPAGAVTLSYARGEVFRVRTYLGAVLGAACAVLLLLRPRLSLLRVLPAALLLLAALHFAGLSFLGFDFAVGAAAALLAVLGLAILARLRKVRIRWPRRKATPAALLLLAFAVHAEDEIIVPYHGEKPGAIEQVFLPAKEYHRLRALAYPDTAGRRTAFASAAYTAVLVDGELAVTAVYEIVKETDEAERVPLRLDGTAVVAAALDGAPANLAVKKKGYVLLLEGRGRKTLTLSLRPRVAQGGFAVPVVPVANAVLRVTDKEGHDTRVTALGARTGGVHHLGPVSALAVRWAPETDEFEAPETELRAHTGVTAAVRDSFTAFAARIRYRLSGGTVERVRVRLDEALVLRRVECADLAGWDVADGVLTVALAKPAAKELVLTLHAERPAARERDETFPEIAPLGVVRDAGVLALETLPDLELELLRTQGLLRAGAAQAPPDLAAAVDKGELHSVHRYAVRPFALAWRVRVEPTRLRAETNVDLYLERTAATAEVRILVTVERGPGVFTVPVRVPAGYEVVGARGRQPLRDWWVDDGTLFLGRTRAQRGTDEYRVLLRRTGPTAEPFAAPAVSVPSAARESGLVRIAVHDGLELETSEASKLMPEDIAKVGKVRRGRLMRAYRFVEAPWGLVVHTRAEPREVEGLVVSRVVPEADRVRVEAIVHYYVRRGLVDEVSFTVPVADENAVLVTAPDLRETVSAEVEGGRRFTLALRTATRGSIAATVTYRLPYDEPVRGVEPLGAARVRRYVAVEKIPDGQVKTLATENLDPGGYDDLPLSHTATTKRSVAGVYVGSGGPFALALEVTRHAFEEVASAVIYRAAAQAVVDRSGWTRAVVSYRVYNRAEQFLRLTLPPKATLYSVLVAGEGVRPLADGGQVLVPLRKIEIGAPTFEVDVTYAYRGPPVGAVDFEVRLPEVDRLDVRRTTLSLYLPDGYGYDFDTEMEEVEEADIAAGEAQDVYEEIKELYAVAERGNTAQAARALENALELEKDARRWAEEVQRKAKDKKQVQRVETQQRALQSLRAQNDDLFKRVQEQTAQSEEPADQTIDVWGVNRGYLDKNFRADNRDLEAFAKNKMAQPQGGLTFHIDGEAPEVHSFLVFGSRTESETRAGIGGGAGGAGGADGALAGPGGGVPPGLRSPSDPAPPAADTGLADAFYDDDAFRGRATNVFDRRLGEGVTVGKVAQLDGLPKLDLLAPAHLRGATGRISIRIELPKEGTVHHFARLGGVAAVEVDASEESRGALPGFLAVVAAAAAVFVLRFRR